MFACKILYAVPLLMTKKKTTLQNLLVFRLDVLYLLSAAGIGYSSIFSSCNKDNFPRCTPSWYNKHTLVRELICMRISNASNGLEMHDCRIRKCTTSQCSHSYFQTKIYIYIHFLQKVRPKHKVTCDLFSYSQPNSTRLNNLIDS